MTTFSYTTGNPSNLTAGATASMNDIQGPFTDLKTFLNGGTFDYVNLASTVDSYYKTIRELKGISVGLTAGTYVFANTTGTSGVDLIAPATAGSGLGIFYLNSADYPTGTRSAKLRVTAVALPNTTAPAIGYGYGLYPVSSAGGGLDPTLTLGALTGTAASISTPGASTGAHSEGADFAVPAAGYYVLALTTSGTEAAGAHTVHRIALQFRAT